MEQKKNPYKSAMTKDLIVSGIALVALVASMFAFNCPLDLPISIVGAVILVGCTVLLIVQNKKLPHGTEQ